MVTYLHNIYTINTISTLTTQTISTRYSGEGGPGPALCGDPAAAAGGLGGCAEHGGGHRQGGEAAQVRRSGQEARTLVLQEVP